MESNTDTENVQSEFLYSRVSLIFIAINIKNRDTISLLQQCKKNKTRKFRDRKFRWCLGRYVYIL